MKTTTFILLACLLTIAIQTAHAQNRIGLKLGLNSANVYSFNTPMETNNRLAFTMGGVGEFDLTDKVGLGVGLLFVGKGYETTKTYRPLYLQVPVRMYYRSKYFSIGVGPYVGVGVGGKIKTQKISGNLSQGFNSEFDWEDLRYGYDQDDHFTPFDVGMGAGLTLHLTRSLRLFTSYDLGLNHVLPSMEPLTKNATVSNAVFCMGLTRLWDVKNK